MNKNVSIAIGVIIVVGALAAYLFWPQPQPEPVHVEAPPAPKPPPPKAEAPRAAEAPPAAPPLPSLAQSDSFVFDALTALVGNKTLMRVFRTEKIIKHVVATVDNLPGRRAPMSVMPIERAHGSFLVAGPDDDLTLSPMNAARYTPYMKVAEAINAKKLVDLYVRLYPLFQDAYEKLGYPRKYFNDRLMAALDDMLNAPDLKGPVKLVQPNVFYQFADPDLEARSIGQRIVMRIGSSNEAILKTKLREIRKELKLRISEGKLASTT